MDVHVPYVSKKGSTSDEKFDPIFSTFLSVLFKQLRSMQNELYSTADIYADKSTFVKSAKETKCTEYGPTVQLQEVFDEACLHRDGKRIVKKCEPIKIQTDPSYDKTKVLTSDTVLRLNDTCYLNQANKASSVCPHFFPFMPAAATQLISVFRQDCLYDVKTSAGAFLTMATYKSSLGNNFQHACLEIVEKIHDDFPKIKQRKIVIPDKDELESRDVKRYIELHEVKMFRGPCILNDFLRTRTRPHKCEINYAHTILKPDKIVNRKVFEGDKLPQNLLELEAMLIPTMRCSEEDTISLNVTKDGFEQDFSTFSRQEKLRKFVNVGKADGNAINVVTFPLYENYKIAEEDHASSGFRCGLSAYIRGRVGYSNIITDDSVNPFTFENAGSLQNSIIVRDESMVTASTLYSKSVNPDSEPARADVRDVQFGKNHESDGLLTLQKFLQRNESTFDWQVFHNRLSFRANDFSGTPDGFVFDKSNTMMATVEVKCVQGKLPNEVPLRVRVQAKAHLHLMNKLGMNLTRCFVVYWSLNETRIFISDNKPFEFIGGQANPDWLDHVVQSIGLQQPVKWDIRSDTFTDIVFSHHTYTISSVRHRRQKCRADIDIPRLGTICPTAMSNFVEVSDVSAHRRFENQNQALWVAFQGKKMYELEVFNKDGAWYRPKLPCHLRIETSHVIATDDMSNTVKFRTLSLETIKNSITDYGTMGELSLLTELQRELPVLRTDGKEDCEDITHYPIVIKSNPIFDTIESWNSFDKQTIIVYNDTLFIQHDGKRYTACVTDEGATTFDGTTTVLKTTDVLEIDGTRFRNFYILREDQYNRYTMVIIHNLNVHYALLLHLKKPTLYFQDNVELTAEMVKRESSHYDEVKFKKSIELFLFNNDVADNPVVRQKSVKKIEKLEKIFNYNVRYWVYLFHLLSLFDEKVVRLNISKNKILDQENTVSHILEAYRALDEKRRLKVKKIGIIQKEGRKDVSQTLLHMLSLNSDVDIQFMSSVINKAKINSYF